MVALKEEAVIKETIFVCIFLNDEGQCLVEKKYCPQNKNEKCKQAEDMFQ